MAGLDKPTSGNVYLDDLDIYTLNDDKLSKYVEKSLDLYFKVIILYLL